MYFDYCNIVHRLLAVFLQKALHSNSFVWLLELEIHCAGRVAYLKNFFGVISIKLAQYYYQVRNIRKSEINDRKFCVDLGVKIDDFAFLDLETFF